ncbi:sigma-54-dependent transcriptional regulator [Candidatus Methanoperedens nitratireducens]|uniref:Putative Response regulator receiver n=1 Tax=Candidatus Methanoperedens nitratireducens TaxID=1392998 RepID=A0A284VQZ4_9EURY|nr:response regulator [Candidatus Methanoperedens nitroreducens]SNQ61597.1 putative Response regulator receiver [Candidatus Methanoperedens nitroreducens]
MKNILIIEDEKEIRDGLVEVLEDAGFAVDSADNGEQGLEKIAKKDFDIVVTDLIMPVVGGMEVLRETKHIKPRTRVILITAFATVDNAVEAMKAGASDYITKPFRIDEVQTKIRKVLAEAEFDKPQIFDSNLIKAISNQIRKDAVKLLYKSGRLKFTEIQRGLGIEDATKLNFHMRVMKEHKIIEQDSEKFYVLTPVGKKLFEALRSAEL